MKPLHVDSDHDSDSSEAASDEQVLKVHHQPAAKSGYNPNK